MTTPSPRPPVAGAQLRGARKRNGRLPRHLLSGLLVCGPCGGTFRRVNGREYGCASHRDGGDAACTNGLRVPIKLAEHKLLNELAEEVLSPEGVALLEKRLREHAREEARVPKAVPKREAAQIAKKSAELEQLRALMKAGTLSQAVAQAAIDRAQEELQALERAQPQQEERHSARIIRMLPRAARVLRERIGAGNLGLRDPRLIVQGRNALFNMFGKIPMRPGKVRPGERPYLVARVALNRNVLIAAAASAAGCVEFGSGGPLL